MEKNVVSLETAQKLKAAGWAKAGSFYWYENNGYWYLNYIHQFPPQLSREIIQAPTAQEFANALPKSIGRDGDTYWLEMKWVGEESRCQYWSHVSQKRLGADETGLDQGAIGVAGSSSMAEALAALWLKLRENEKI